MAAQLRRRQDKCDRKIAEAIEKIKRCQYQMDYYDSLAGGNGLCSEL